METEDVIARPSEARRPTFKRRKESWIHTAPVMVPELMFPREVCLLSTLCVEDLRSAAQISGSPMWVFQSKEFKSAAQALRATARLHTLYPIVIRGDCTKFCTQGTLRRLEFLAEWHVALCSQRPHDVASIVATQRDYGIKRQMQRNRREGRKGPDVSRVKDPLGLEALLRTPAWSLEDAMAVGTRRTLRVYDISGACVWLLPATTLALLAGVIEEQGGGEASVAGTLAEDAAAAAAVTGAEAGPAALEPLDDLQLLQFDDDVSPRMIVDTHL